MDVLPPLRHPWVLSALIVPLALLIWTWRRRGRAVALPFDHAYSPSSRLLRVLINGCESLPALLLAVIVLVLAGPQNWDEPRSRRVLTNIEFCVDVSGSMTAGFGDGTRYDAAMDAINAFLDRRHGDAFGLTFFGNNVLHWCPLTTDISAFRCAPPFMRPGSLPPWFGGTEIGKALLACRKVLLEREEGDRMIVLVSDGHSWDLAGGKAEEVARRLKDDGVVVFAVHVAEGSVPDDIVSIASITGGEAFATQDRGALDHVFERIDSMQKTRLEKCRPEATDDYLPLCLLGLGLLGTTLLTYFGLRPAPW